MSRKLRYEGLRWRIRYGGFDGLERRAVIELQRGLQDSVPYVVEVLRHDEPADPAGPAHEIWIGTAASNPGIAARVAEGRLTIPAEPESMAVRVYPPAPASGEAPATREAAVAGADAPGVLNAAMTFCSRVLGVNVYGEKMADRQGNLARLCEWDVREAPAVADRGIWTWGYVIYDYRRFIDNMVRLKLNYLTIWNDRPPLNVLDLLDYAHGSGVRVALGFSWGWGTEHLGELRLGREADRHAIRERTLADYDRHYRGLPIDGIYFQTLTEHNVQAADGTTTAAAACELVNDIAGELLRREPALDVQFGLHATSIREHYTDLSALDPRVTITWEDAGTIPYAYEPWSDPRAPRLFEETLDYSRRLAVFRPATTFAIVPKGFIHLRWQDEFENHGAFILGERSRRALRQRLLARRAQLEKVNRLWHQYFPLAARFYREMLACRPARMRVTGLVEDGAFEERIQPGVALFAEMLWNPHRTDNELLEAALNSWYEDDE